MQKYTNDSNISLLMAVFLATDTYDHNLDPFTISATSLLRPLRQLILSSRVPPSQTAADISSQINNSMGTAIHDAIENAWNSNYEHAMKMLGYPAKLIDRIKINPSNDYLKNNPDCVPVYLEQRFKRPLTINGKTFTITGKVDFVAQGRVQDIKTTTAYTYQKGNKAEDYSNQGSIYRWLEPRKIVDDVMSIHFYFRDWQAYKLKSEKNYPPAMVHTKDYLLKSLPETETLITHKLTQYDNLKDADENQIPRCTDEELWMDGSVWKYYKDPDKLTRATKNFDSPQDAYAHKAEKGCGVVLEVKSPARACNYCPAFHACSQKDDLLRAGLLNL